MAYLTINGLYNTLSISEFNFSKNLNTMSKYSTYKHQKIVSMWREGFKVPTTAKLLRDENLLFTRQGIWEFLKKYEATNLISRREGSGRKSKITDETKEKVDSRMEDDDETTIKVRHQSVKSEPSTPVPVHVPTHCKPVHKPYARLL